MQDSKRQEKAVAKAFEGRTTLASGALKFDKGDVETSKYLIECKTTEKNSFIIKKAVLEKIRREAINKHKFPLMSIEFQGYGRFILLREDLFLELEEGYNGIVLWRKL